MLWLYNEQHVNTVRGGRSTQTEVLLYKYKYHSKFFTQV